MIKKPLGLLLSGVLTIGLAACNNNGNDAADEVRTGRIDRDNNSTLNVGNGRDDGIDHNGPLTEDYTNNDNNDPDWDRNRNNVTNVNNDRNTNRNNNQRNVNNNRLMNTDRHIFNDRNVNYNTGRNMNNNNDGLDISADRTTLDSKSYPHTKAILIQHAQYRYIPFGSVQWYQFGGGNQQGKTPTQQQVPTVPAPAAPTPAPTAPTPAPTAPTPAQHRHQQPADQHQQLRHQSQLSQHQLHQHQNQLLQRQLLVMSINMYSRLLI